MPYLSHWTSYVFDAVYKLVEAISAALCLKPQTTQENGCSTPFVHNETAYRFSTWRA
jgi:hypothetical protein